MVCTGRARSGVRAARGGVLTHGAQFATDMMVGFDERYVEADIKLVLCTIACLAAGFGCIYGLFVPHPESTPGDTPRSPLPDAWLRPWPHPPRRK